jgi:hypothetical protein
VLGSRIGGLVQAAISQERRPNTGTPFDQFVDHLCWDLKQIFDMAVAEGIRQKEPSPAPLHAQGSGKPVHRVMSFQDVREGFGALAQRERSRNSPSTPASQKWLAIDNKDDSVFVGPFWRLG